MANTVILDTKTVVTAQCMFGVVGNSANWDPGKTFVTAQCMSGVVSPIHFLNFNARDLEHEPASDVGFACRHACCSSWCSSCAGCCTDAVSLSLLLLSWRMVKSHMPVTRVFINFERQWCCGWSPSWRSRRSRRSNSPSLSHATLVGFLKESAS